MERESVQDLRSLIEPADNAFGADFPEPPEQLMATTAEAVVPRDLLATLPDAALLAFRWGFTPGSSARDRD